MRRRVDEVWAFDFLILFFPPSLLKSYPWASCLSDPGSEFSVKSFCDRTHLALPRRDDAAAARPVHRIRRSLPGALRACGGSGFRAVFADGETVQARRVVVAVGLHPFKRLPREAKRLPSRLCSHSGEYGSLASLDVIGTSAKFPELINLLSEDVRVRLANTKALGPLGGAFVKEQVVGQVPLWLGRSICHVESARNKVLLDLRAAGGGRQTLQGDHVIFATGYKVDVSRLDFLSPGIVQRLRLVEPGAAALRRYETSVRGLHFIGPAAANSFGPVSRFVYGTHHPARHLAHHLATVLPRVPSRTTGHPVQLDVSPEFVPERRVSRFPGGGRVRCYHELPGSRHPRPGRAP